MKKWIFILIGLAVVFFLGTLKVDFHKPSLSQKVTYDRVTQAPLLTLSKIFDKMRCSIGDAGANLQSFTAANGYENPGDCGCEGIAEGSSLAVEWNDCLGCLFMMLVDVYSRMTETLADEGVDPDTDFNSTITFGSSTQEAVAESSSLTGYDRHISITNTSGDAVCINLHYSKDATDSEKVKAIMHLDNSNCYNPSGMGDSESHAMAMIFDLRYTDANLQTATFFHTGDYDTNGFSVTGTDQDDIFYMNVEVDESSGSPATQAWVIRISQNDVWKFYLNGEDDVRLLVATVNHSAPPSLADTTVDDSDLTTQCVDDSSATSGPDADVSACTAAGYIFNNFPLTVDSISDKTYPSWTTSTLNVTVDADVEDYF